MLVTGNDVDALFGWRLDIARAARVRMDQRGVGAPVFGCRVGGKNLGHATQLALAPQQAIRLAGERVRLLVGCEWEQPAEALRIGLGRLTVALVELAAARARHVWHQPVEDLPTAFVEVETVVQQLAQEAAAL